jgi:serine/threonine protein kinase
MIERVELDLEFRREIGQEGRNSRTYEAFDPQLNAVIVVKKVLRSDFADVDGYFKEAQRLYDARHPNVVPIYFACRTPDEICLAMPLYTGSVHSLLERQSLTVREIVKYGLGFLSGLHHVHVRGLLHLDVKPSNVLIDRADRAALADFGLAQRVDADGLAEQDIMYRPHRVPEALTGSKVGAPADIYQAGLTLYRMAMGGSSLDDQWATFGIDDQEAYRAVLRGELPDRSNGAFPAHIPSNLKRLIQRALEVDPDARFGTVLDLLAELAKVDQYLDWRYEADGAGTEVWTKSAVDRDHEVTLLDDGSGNLRVTAKTRRLDTGAEKKRPKLGGTVTTRAAASKLVHAAMEEFK